MTNEENNSLKELYELVNLKELSTGIKIVAPPSDNEEYEGMMWEYGEVSFEEQPEGLEVKFTYTIHENPNNIKEDEDLKTFMGNVLMEILETNLGSYDD